MIESTSCHHQVEKHIGAFNPIRLYPWHQQTSHDIVDEIHHNIFLNRCPNHRVSIQHQTPHHHGSHAQKRSIAIQTSLCPDQPSLHTRVLVSSVKIRMGTVVTKDIISAVETRMIFTDKYAWKLQSFIRAVARV